MRLAIPILLTLSLLVLLFVRRIPVRIRITCILACSLVFSMLALTGSLAPHRMAQSKLDQKPSTDWGAGALATRDAIRIPTVLWLLSVGLLGFSSTYLLIQLSKKNSATPPGDGPVE